MRDFYRYTEGLNPLQVTAAHIEDWYDNLTKRVDRNTAAPKVARLKRFFSGVKSIVPIISCSRFAMS